MLWKGTAMCFRKQANRCLTLHRSFNSFTEKHSTCGCKAGEAVTSASAQLTLAADFIKQLVSISDTKNCDSSAPTHKITDSYKKTGHVSSAI